MASSTLIVRQNPAGERVAVLLGGGVDAMAIAERVSEELPVLLIDQQRIPRAGPWSKYAVQASCYNAEESLAALLEFMRSTDVWPAAVLCAGTDTPHVQTRIAGFFGLPHPDPERKVLWTDKFLQVQALFLEGITVPDFWLAKERPNQYPIVVKPREGRGARGVIRLTDAGQWDAVSAEGRVSRGMLAERWVEGVQLSSESIVSRGRVVWTAFAERNYSRLGQFAPSVIEDGSDMPPGILRTYERDYELLAGEQLEVAARVLGVTDGTLKGDLVWDGERVWVIEVAPRLSGGSFCSRMIPWCWGVDVVGEALHLARWGADYVPHVTPFLRAHVCQRFDFPVRPHSHPERGGMALGRGRSQEEALQNCTAELTYHRTMRA